MVIFHSSMKLTDCFWGMWSRGMFCAFWPWRPDFSCRRSGIGPFWIQVQFLGGPTNRGWLGLHWHPYTHYILVGGDWLPFLAFSQKYWVSVIIPLDELLFFRGVFFNHQPAYYYMRDSISSTFEDLWYPVLHEIFPRIWWTQFLISLEG